VSELEKLLEQPIHQIGLDVGNGHIVFLNLDLCDDEAEKQDIIGKIMQANIRKNTKNA
jgi:hypothetical protein